jgi:hypothetical protein
MPIGSSVFGAFLALFLCVGSAYAAEPTDLRELARKAPRIVTGRVASTVDYSSGRLRLHTVAVSQTLAGEAVTEITVLEERKSSINILSEGEQYLFFLTLAPDNSLTRQNLPKRADSTPIGGQAGVVLLRGVDDAEVADLIGLLRKDPLGSTEQRRVLRIELQSGARRFVEDAATILATTPGLGSALDVADVDAIDVALRDVRTTDETKAVLIRALAQGQITQARPLLSALRPSTGPVIEARAEALRQLGHGIGWSEISEYVNSPDPAVRKSGIRALADSRDAEAREQLDRVALEPGPTDVRVAAVEALGKVGEHDAIEVLSRTFEDSNPEVQIASGRALFEVGTDEAHQSLETLVMEGKGYEVQSQALVLLVLSGYPTDDPRIQRIREKHPDARIRKIIDEGLELAPPGHVH